MTHTIDLRGSRTNKFTQSKSSGRGNSVRKNLVMDKSLHDLVVYVTIEKEISIKRFVEESLDRQIETIPASPDSWNMELEDESKVGTSVFLPRELAKEIKRTSHATGASENQVILKCVKAELKALKASNPELFPAREDAEQSLSRNNAAM